MNLLLLPGNSPRHEAWVDSLRDALAPQFGTTIAQHYRHWQTGKPIADVAHEINAAQKHAADLEPYAIIAKSIGTVIAAQGTAEGKLHPSKIILLGVPLEGSVDRDAFAEWLTQITVPVIIVQNSQDPFGAFTDVKAALEGKSKNLRFVELIGDTHDYLDLGVIAQLV